MTALHTNSHDLKTMAHSAVFRLSDEMHLALIDDRSDLGDYYRIVLCWAISGDGSWPQPLYDEGSHTANYFEQKLMPICAAFAACGPMGLIRAVEGLACEEGEALHPSERPYTLEQFLEDIDSKH